MASVTDLLTAMLNGVQAIEDLTIQIRDSFPSITTLSSVAPTAGAVTYSSSLVSAFGLVQTSSGGTYRIALLPSS